MATPQPEAGGPLSSRTTAQPPRPLGQAASGEKDLLKDLRPSDVRPVDIRPPETLPLKIAAKPLDTPATTPTERPPLKAPERPAAAIPERPAAAIPERPLTKPPQRPIAATPERAPAKPIERLTPEPVARAPRPAAPQAAAAKDWGLTPVKKRASILGPIATAILLIGVAAGGYYGYTQYFASAASSEQPEGVPIAGNDDAPPAPPADDEISDLDDPFNDSAATPAKGIRTTSAPRLAQHNSKVIPIQNAAKQSAGKKGGKSHPLADGGEQMLELPDETDEPEEDAPSLESANESEQPLLRVPPNRDSSTATRSSADKNGSRDAAELDEDPLSDYSYADDRPATDKSRSAKGPKISIVEAHDEREPTEQLEGFEPEDGNRRRAVARTVVVRSDSAAAAVEPSNDGWVEDSSRLASRQAPGRPARPDSATPATKIQPRGTTSSSTATPQRELRPAADATPHRESYTVVANDNFWTISRKQYGSGRYFAALARHNQERIPDPQRLRPGMQVATPPAKFLEERYPELIDKSGATPAPAASHNTPGDNRPQFAAPSSPHPTTEKSVASQSAGYFYSKGGEPLYRIGADDTLSSIALRHLGRSARWPEIYEQNREILKNPENLPLGTVIRLPPDASRVGLAPERDLRR